MFTEESFVDWKVGYFRLVKESKLLHPNATGIFSVYLETFAVKTINTAVQIHIVSFIRVKFIRPIFLLL